MLKTFSATLLIGSCFLASSSGLTFDASTADRACYGGSVFEFEHEAGALRTTIQQSEATRGRKIWRKLTLEGFSILMPGEATREASTDNTAVGAAQGYTYSVDLGTEAYIVSYSDFPPSKWDFNGVGVEGLKKGFAKLGGEILLDREINIRSYKGREIIFTDKENRRFRLHAYSVEPRLYQIFYITTGESVYSDDILKFFDSFVIDEEFARSSAEKRIEYDVKQLSQELASEFPQFSNDSLVLLGKEILRRRLTPAEAGRFGWQSIEIGVRLLTKDEQDELSKIGNEMLSGLTNDESAKFKLLHDQAASKPLTKEETNMVGTLLTKAFGSLSLTNRTRFRFLMGKALRLALSNP